MRAATDCSVQAIDFDGSFERAGFRYESKLENGRLFHAESAHTRPGEPLFQQRVPVDFAVGSAIDVLEGSAAQVTNCLFVANISNYGMDELMETFRLAYKPKHGCGAVTVFPNSRLEMSRSTLTNNWNGIDDSGTGSRYLKCILWNNNAGDGSRPGEPYEFDVTESASVEGCMIGGGLADLRDTIDHSANTLNAIDPGFDGEYIPTTPGYASVGYRPMATR